MKRLLFITAILCFSFSAVSTAQIGKFLKNVKSSVADDLLGNNKNSNKPAPEPPCACEPADLIIDLGKYKMGYTELNINVLSDGRIILQDKMTSSYYVVKDGVTEGPLKDNDPRVKQFEQIVENDNYQEAMLAMYKDYISKQGDKYIINFAGKTYGPYGMINTFAVTRSKDKFAAKVTATVMVTEDDGKKMEEAMKNAKSDQERMDLAMKYGQQMQEKMMSGGGPESIQQKIVTNVAVPTADILSVATSFLNASMKYDDIVLVTESKITDIQGKTLFDLKMGQYDPESTFISSDNSRYSAYSYGTLTISDGKKLTDLFNPMLLKAEGKVYLAYMYYSPKRNAIMQCKIPF